ncbi:hypothetical protein ACGFSI_26055 [Streptomyces virginiae]|uniref:hypothetical protein n=1 Tax=Streptomyces virginiae TaxID=1961 RepID=UPI0037192734
MPTMLRMRTCAVVIFALLSVSGGYAYGLPPATSHATTDQRLALTPPPAPYPLTRAQALNLLGAGTPVAGRYGGGFEGQAKRTTETAYREERVRREKCEYVYDTYKDKEVLKCHDEYVTEKVPYDKTVYWTSVYNTDLGEFSQLTFPSAAQAIAYISSYGVTGWRQVTR